MTPGLRPALRALALPLLFAASLAVAATATAHAELVSSDPADAATVGARFAGPIVLTYSEALQPGSHAELLDASGAKVADAAVDTANPIRMVFSLASPLASARYTVQWTSVAADKDVDRGTVSFTVAAPTPPPATLPPAATAAPSASALPSSSPSAAPTPSPLPSATPAQGPAASATDVAIPIVVALALVLVVGLYLLRRGRPAA